MHVWQLRILAFVPDRKFGLRVAYSAAALVQHSFDAAPCRAVHQGLMVAAASQRIEAMCRRGRRAGTIAYGLLVGGFTIVCAAQILDQVWGPHEGPLSPVDCRVGVKRLSLAVHRARGAGEAETGGERAAVTRFRQALRPEWNWRSALGRACQGDRVALQALGDTDRLRYAEEHAVRYESVELARRRRRVSTLDRWAPKLPSPSEGPLKRPAVVASPSGPH